MCCLATRDHKYSLLNVYIYRMVFKCHLRVQWSRECSTSHIHSSTHPLYTPTSHTHPTIEPSVHTHTILIHTRTVTHSFSSSCFFMWWRRTKWPAQRKRYQHSDYSSRPLSKLAVLKEVLVFWVTLLLTQDLATTKFFSHTPTQRKKKG